MHPYIQSSTCITTIGDRNIVPAVALGIDLSSAGLGFGWCVPYGAGQMDTSTKHEHHSRIDRWYQGFHLVGSIYESCKRGLQQGFPNYRSGRLVLKVSAFSKAGKFAGKYGLSGQEKLAEWDPCIGKLQAHSQQQGAEEEVDTLEELLSG